MGRAVSVVACGSEYSAAVTTAGELYMWGRGNYGRLGIGTSDDLSVPTHVSFQRVVMCVADEGKTVERLG